MMRSLYSGVAGLRTHQTKMDVLGNNIANVNTTSFKSQSITFSDLMYQTTQTASGATETKGGVNARQIGLGAKSGAIATAIESQGATQTTNNPFDIMITGKAFFVVNNGKENLYTRDGSFYVDGAGNLAMQSNGYLVQGWVAQEDKETGEIKVNKNGGLASLQIMSPDNSTYSPASTTAALYSGNIDDHDTNVTSDDGKTITLEFYDNKGYLYTGKFTLKDTGTDHLFSLQLTDIIDSDGNSLGEKILKGVTFGSVASTDPIAVQQGYTVSVVDGVATIKQDANTVKYDAVPASGNLKDLMSTSYSSKNYSGVLEEAYCLTDDDVMAKLGSYYATATYSINPGSGLLKIEWTETDTYNKQSDYSYSSNVSSSYYYDRNSGIGYRVPSTMTGKEADDLTAYDRAAFEKVFTDGTNPPTIDNNHTYSFDSTTGVLTVSDIVTLEQKDTDFETTIASLRGSQDSFPASGSYGNLESVLDAATDPIYYTFNGTNLVVKNANATTDYEKTATDVNAGTTNPLISGNLGDKYDIADLATMISSDGLDAIADQFGDYSAYQKFTVFEDVSGTYAISFFKEVTTYSPGDTIYSGSVNNSTYTADDTTYKKTASTAFTSMWYSTSLGHDYLVRNDQSSVADYSTEFLKKVFTMTDEDIASYDSLPNSVSFISSGIKINTTKSDTQEASLPEASLYPSYDEDNKYFKFLTKNAQTRWVVNADNMSGNITELLNSASGPYAGLLETVYGITDADARAYGLDGGYSINKDGTMTLKTGDKTIQLTFDPANGSLTAANGIPNGLVDLVFDQKVPGLEAFGYQKGATDGDEVVPGHLTVDFSTVTNYNTSGSSTIKAVKGDKKSLNTGRAVGEMNGVTVSTDGQIYATYSNGQTKLLGQIASAEFANASGLSKEGDNLYSSTLNSGDPTIQDITTDGGYMNTGVLEMSNVDLSKEFTEMITTQRGFQANSRIITVSDTLLEELTNLKR